MKQSGEKQTLVGDRRASRRGGLNKLTVWCCWFVRHWEKPQLKSPKVGLDPCPPSHQGKTTFFTSSFTRVFPQEFDIFHSGLSPFQGQSTQSIFLKS